MLPAGEQSYVASIRLFPYDSEVLGFVTDHDLSGDPVMKVTPGHPLNRISQTPAWYIAVNRIAPVEERPLHEPPNSSNRRLGLADRRRSRSFLAHPKNSFLHQFPQLQNPSIVFQDWSPDISDR